MGRRRRDGRRLARMGVRHVLLVCGLLTVCFPERAAANEQQLIEACFNAVNADSKSACSLCQEAADRTTGPSKTVALINLARCEAARGRPAHALATYRQVRSLLDANDERVIPIDAQIAELEGRVGRLRFDWTAVPPAADVRLDEEPLAARPAELEVASGTRTVVVRVAGHEPHTISAEVAPRGAADVVLVVGRELPRPVPRRAADPGTHPQRIAGFIVGGLGVAGAISFGITGALALDRQATVDELCPEEQGRVCRDPAGVDAADEGKTLNIVNAVSLAVGAAALATGLVLVLTAPDAESVGVALVPQGAGFALLGAF